MVYMPGYELVGNEELEALQDIFKTSNGVLFAHGFDQLRNGRFRIREFERAFNEKMGFKHTLAVTSGTAAQYIAMQAMGVKAGDEVITQSFTFVATVETILALGAIPVVVDIDDTFNMCPKALEKAITKKTKLIVPVHMLGNPCDMDAINSIAKKHNIPVLEDACEALGATYKGKAVGNLGDASVFSLDFGKVITCGEGGLICTSNPDIDRYCREYHDHGHENNPSLPRGKDTRTIAGLNFRMTEMQGAIGLAQLKKLDHILQRNRRNKTILKNILKQYDQITFRKITDEKGDLADTLIFSFKNNTIAEQFVAQLKMAGLGTKNVPDAIDWHFAGTWKHMFQNHSQYGNCWDSAWKKSAELLYRSAALPILVNKTEDDMQEIGFKVLNILKEL